MSGIKCRVPGMISGYWLMFETLSHCIGTDLMVTVPFQSELVEAALCVMLVSETLHLGEGLLSGSSVGSQALEGVDNWGRVGGGSNMSRMPPRSKHELSAKKSETLA